MRVYKQKITGQEYGRDVPAYLYAVRHGKSWNATIWLDEDDFYEMREENCGGISHLSDNEFFDRIRAVAERDHEFTFADKAEAVAWSPYIDSEEERVSAQHAPLGSIPNHGLLSYRQCHDYLTQMYRNCTPLLQGYAGLTIQREETSPLEVEMLEKAKEALKTAWKAVENALAFSHFAGQQVELENPNHTARSLVPAKLATDSGDTKPDLWEFGSEEAPAFVLPESYWGKKHGFARFRINEADKAQGLLTVHVAVHDSHFKRHYLAIYDGKRVPENGPELTWTPNQWADHLIKVAPPLVKALLKSIEKPDPDSILFDESDFETLH